MSTQLPLRLQAEQMTYGAEMRAHRKELKLWQSEVGAQVGVTNTAVSQWERDRRKRPRSKKAAAALEWLRQQIANKARIVAMTAPAPTAPEAPKPVTVADMAEGMRALVQKASEAFPPKHDEQWHAIARVEVNGPMRTSLTTIAVRASGSATALGYVPSEHPEFTAQTASCTDALKAIENEIEAKDPRNRERRRLEVLRKLTVEEQELLGIKPS